MPDAKLQSGCTPAAVKAAEKKLRLRLPDDLAAFLLEADGATGGFWGYDIVWPLDQIVQTHLIFRSDYRDLYMSFEGLLFFGAAANGDQYGFRVLEQAPGDVFLWDHEDDSRTWFARGLDHYLERIGQEARARETEDTEQAGAEPVPRRQEGLVSVWVGDQRTRDSFRSYTALGAGLFRQEGEPSLLEDFKIAPVELAWPIEIRESWQAQPAAVSVLVSNLWEGEHFAGEAAEAARRMGKKTARSVLIVYGFAYEPAGRGVAEKGQMAFLGSFRYRAGGGQAGRE
jgi:hypothetical protein